MAKMVKTSSDVRELIRFAQDVEGSANVISNAIGAGKYESGAEEALQDAHRILGISRTLAELSSRLLTHHGIQRQRNNIAAMQAEKNRLEGR
jgi:hypothetical protein